jgi:hypothetical protein
MDILRSIVVGAAMLALPAGAQDHRFETDPVATVRENFVLVMSSRNYSASWTTRVFCLLANASRCPQDIESVSTQAAGRTSVSIRKIQHGENSSLIGQGYAGLSPSSADRTHCVGCPG